MSEWGIVEHLEKEWKTFKSAPIICIVFAIIGGLIVYFIFWGAISTKNATIEYQQALLNGDVSGVKTIVFDGSGKVLAKIGTKKVINRLQVKPFKKGEYDLGIIVELQTKEYLSNIPHIQTITDRFNVEWAPTRKGENIIVWFGKYTMFTDDEIPKFKIEIYN